MTSSDTKHGLTRDLDDAWLGGVASGISDAMSGLTANQVRGAFAIGSAFAGLGALAYVAAWLYMPARPTRPSNHGANRELWLLGGLAAIAPVWLAVGAGAFTWTVWLATAACAGVLAVRRAEHVGPAITADATDTYNPILAKWQSSLERVRRRPLPEPGVALVLYGENGYLDTLWQQRTAQDSQQWHQARTIYRVDVSEHTIVFDTKLPSAGDAFAFNAKATVVCCVDDPRTIVDRNTHDITRTLRPMLEQTMRNISRTFQPEQSAEAETHIADAVAGADLGVGVHIIRFLPTVELDDASKQHLRRMRGYDWEQRENRASADVAVERTRQELQLDGIRVEYYRNILEAGELSQLALQITHNPDEIPAVANIIRTANDDYRAWLTEQLGYLYERDGFEGHDLETASQVAIKRLAEEIAGDSHGPHELGG